MKKISPRVLGGLIGVVVFGTATLHVSAATLTPAQVDAILGLVRSFGVAEQLVENTRAALEERAPAQVAATPLAAGGERVGCHTFTRWMMIGTLDTDVDGDVSRLQKLLSSLGYYADAVTGKFGAMTRAAVERFQAAKGIVSSGDIDTTGFGGVGPATREALSRASCPAGASAGTAAPSAGAASGTSTAPLSSTATTSVTVLSPNGGERFTQGQQWRISWSGGGSKVQIGIVDKRYETDSSVVDWISLNERPDGSLVWNGEKVTDLTGTASHTLSALSSGPYKIIAVSSGAGGRYCVVQNSGCNYDVSNSYFAVTSPASGGAFVASCRPSSVGLAHAGAPVTWEAAATNGATPYAYHWQGTDIGPVVAVRSDGKFLEMFYATPGLKTAYVTARDAQGKETSASCTSPVTITPAPSPITVLSPNGGERFVLTKTFDQSQFVNVSWRLKEMPSLRGKILWIALQDTGGRTCVVGSAPSRATNAFVGLIDGYRCPSGNRVLSPGQYTVKVYVDGNEATAFDTSDSVITLTAPISDIQSVTPSAPVVNSQESVKFRFVFPPNALKGSLYLFCPNGVSATLPNVCNAYTDITSYIASSTDYTIAFSNASSQEQNVTANFYVSLPNNPNHKRGVSTQVTIRYTPAAAGASVGDAITILSPNGGEKIQFDVPYVYRFKYSQTGEVDMMLVPYPPIDAGLVCQIVRGAPVSPGQLFLTLKEAAACMTSQLKVAAGTYMLRATLKSGGAILGSDSSDSYFTIAATSTATSTASQ